MEENEGAGRRFDNIALLHKVGEYYARIGIARNEYFEEEFLLLLELCADCRQQEFHEEHQEYLAQLQQLQPCVSKERVDLAIRYRNEVAQGLAREGRLERASQELSSLLELAYLHSDLHINTQLEVLLTKVHIELANSHFDASENTLEKIAFIISNSPFETQYDTKRFQGLVEYLKARHEVAVMRGRREEVKKKRVAAAESSISTALSIFTNLPESN